MFSLTKELTALILFHVKPKSDHYFNTISFLVCMILFRGKILFDNYFYFNLW